MTQLWLQRPSWVCAVQRRRFPVGASPTRQPLQPEATGAVMEATKWLKPYQAGRSHPGSVPWRVAGHGDGAGSRGNAAVIVNQVTLPKTIVGKQDLLWTGDLHLATVDAVLFFFRAHVNSPALPLSLACPRAGPGTRD